MGMLQTISPSPAASNTDILYGILSTNTPLYVKKPLAHAHLTGQDIWMDVVMKLFAVSLVSAVSASAVSAWKWSVALCGAMAVLVWVTRPYMQPQASRSDTD